MFRLDDVFTVARQALKLKRLHGAQHICHSLSNAYHFIVLTFDMFEDYS
jgi:hypothetical protein